MNPANIPSRPFVLTLGALVTTIAVSVGCDRSSDAPRQPDVSEQQRMTDPAPASPAAGEDAALTEQERLNRYAEQQQEPDRDMSTVGDGGEDQQMAQFAMIDVAMADVQPTADYAASGTVTFTPNEDHSRMNIHIALDGLTPGKHGVHIHQNGDCSAPDAKSAGGHFNPYEVAHGPPQIPPHHLGDLGNVEADANERVDTTVTVAELGFSGPASVLQKAFIVHADEDDLQSQPSGDAGDRAGCGVIRQQREVLSDTVSG